MSVPLVEVEAGDPTARPRAFAQADAAPYAAGAETPPEYTRELALLLSS
ncbi:MAG TPA: hypothetical protein VJZ25_01540 [Gemmatimonadaceae bacterium]|nr:hypothetical protein [Gemmatimonadaceae bacterium]